MNNCPTYLENAAWSQDPEAMGWDVLRTRVNPEPVRRGIGQSYSSFDNVVKSDSQTGDASSRSGLDQETQQFADLSSTQKFPQFDFIALRSNHLGPLLSGSNVAKRVEPGVCLGTGALSATTLNSIQSQSGDLVAQYLTLCGPGLLPGQNDHSSVETSTICSEYMVLEGPASINHKAFLGLPIEVQHEGPRL